MRIPRRYVVGGVLLALVVAASALWYSYGPPGQAASVSRSQGQALLEAIVKQVRTSFIEPNVDEQKLYQDALKGLLEAAGPACARVVGEGGASPDGKTRFFAVVDQVADRCPEPRPDVRQLFFAAASRMLEGLGDEYTRFMVPRAYHEFRQDAQGFFFGIGIFIDLRDKQLIVVQPIPGTPAARAGLRAGDRVREIDGVSTEGMALQEAVVRIRGPKGTTVKLGMGRGERTFEVTIVRDRIQIVAAEGADPLDAATREQLHQAGIGYIKLVVFNETTAKEFDRLFADVNRARARGLILDLRNNGGGLLDESLKVADRFVAAGRPMVHTVDRNGRRETQRATRRSKVSMPVVVLVNEFTASASEIVAGALQDHGIGPLIGVKTFGKGVIQTIVDLPLDSGAAITTAKYLTPNGRDIHTKGLVPDATIGEPEETLRQRLRGRPDFEFDAALRIIQADQFQRAIEVLKRKMGRSHLDRQRIAFTPRAVGTALAV